MKESKFDLEDRLVIFAGNIIQFSKTLPFDKAGKTLEDQIVRASISSALNYGEVQGTGTDKDFLNKMRIVLKEQKETRVGLKIIRYANIGDQGALNVLMKECCELIAISATRIKNREAKMK